jgi:amino acid adenylation domain-containing protein
LRRFWQEKLEDCQDLNVVPDRPWPVSPDYRGADIRLDVGTEVSQQLRRLAEELRVSLFSLLLSAHFLTLRCFTNQDDIVVGTPIANRDHPQLARLIGFFVNTLPMRSRIDGQARVTDYVRQTAREVLDVLRHQELPLEQLLEILNVERNVSRHPIFQVTFGVQSFGASTRGKDASLQAVLRTSPETYSLYTAARFDLSTFIDDSAESLELNINYATSLFERATVDSLAQTYLTILRQFADLAWSETRQRQFKISDLVYVDGSRRRELVEEWSAPRKRHDAEMLLHRTFEKHASRLPQRVALVWEERPRTYRELNAEANRLAHHLLSGSKVAPNSIVLLCLDRGADIVVSILATLKAGGCYLPADPTYPDDRIAFMLHDAGVRTILIHARYADRFAEILARAAGDDGRPDLSDIDVIAVDDPTAQALFRAMPATDPITEVTPGDLAYVLYTSGTTGKPKGVPQPHANVARLFAALEGVYRIREDDVWTLFHNFVFDFTVWEMWGAYLYGGRLVVPTFEETRDPKLFYALCRRESVTMLCQTPTAFYQFVNVALAEDESRRLDDLRYVFFGGEPLNVSLLKEWFARYSYDRPLLAMGYGTTETTVFTCYKIYDETDEGSTDIGTLIPGVAGYVLDGQQRLLPMGAVGELHIGGAGLAPGFLNLPDLTASKFITNPFVADSERSSDEPPDVQSNSRLYKSGDLVRWAPDRTLRFAGRNDLQVKIRGHRIELGEIETVISGVPGVLHCAVVVRRSGAGGGESQLVGYYVAESDVETDVVFEHLRAKLPLYMIPAALVPMDELPRRISGKLDVDALPAPRLDTMHEIVAPRNERQAKALKVLAEILCADVEALSIQDNFFELGGNSILSIKLANRLSAELEVDVNVAAIFRHGSVAGLVDSLGTERTKLDRIRRAPESPDTEQVLSFQQESLWFVDRYEGGTDAYNIHLCYEVVPGVAVDVLEDGFRAVYKRHEVLRTVIRQRTDGELYQSVLDPQVVPLPVGHATVIDTDDLAVRVSAEAKRTFDLATEPPFRITFYREASEVGSLGRAFVGIFAHHIAFDGWSADVLMQELERFYAHSGQVQDGAATPGLPESSIQYRDYAVWQRERLSGDRLQELLGYWKARLRCRKPMDLPLDRARPPRMDDRGERLVFTIEVDTSLALRRLASQAGVGLFSVLLSAYYLTLQAFTGRSELLVGVPVANRSHGQTHDLIGCFINSLALDFEIDSDDDVLTLIKKVGARVAEAQDHQELPFERLVAELSLPVDTSRHPLFQVWFDFHSFAHTNSKRAAGPALLRNHDLDGDFPDRAAATKKLDLGLFMNSAGESLVGTITYAVSLFDRPTVDNFASVYRTILMQFARLS